MTITRAGTVGVYVGDQARALDFYVNKLGFEKRLDEPLGPRGSLDRGGSDRRGDPPGSVHATRYGGPYRYLCERSL